MDNAKTHTCKKVLEFLENQEFEVIYGVPYTPEFNAIELFFMTSRSNTTREFSKPGINTSK